MDGNTGGGFLMTDEVVARGGGSVDVCFVIAEVLRARGPLDLADERLNVLSFKLVSESVSENTIRLLRNFWYFLTCCGEASKK